MLKILNLIAQTIYDKKGQNSIALDVRGICTLTDYFFVAEGSVDRHVKALSWAVQEKLAEKGYKLLFSEGEQEGDWIVLDYGDFMIHLFTQELRELYALEEVWKEGKIVDLTITTEQE